MTNNETASPNGWSVSLYTVQQGQQWWLVTEREDQPERGYLFRHEPDAYRLQSQLTALSRQLAETQAALKEIVDELYDDNRTGKSLSRVINKAAALLSASAPSGRNGL